MPWEKQFERKDVLEKAMQAFWRHGYEGTSMKDLIGCMGLNPGSIYATFGDKKKLFCEALDLYESHAREVLHDYETTYGPRQAILAVFEGMLSDAHKDGVSCSCFLINSIVGVASKDPDIDRVTKIGLLEFEEFFRRMIKAGQKQGDINLSVDPDKTARILIGLVISGRILGRGYFDDSQLHDYLDHAASLLA